MGMNNYNRQNPFMYLLESKQTELINDSTSSIKHMIVMFIISIITIILNIICSLLFTKYLLILIPIILYLNIMTFIEIRSCVREIHEQEIDELIFGDTYKDINLNNEMILSMINKYNVAIGKITHANEMTYIYSILYTIMISIFIVLCMIKIF